MISSVIVSLIFKDIHPVFFILSQRSTDDTFSLAGSVSFNLSQFGVRWPVPLSLKLANQRMRGDHRNLT